MNIRDRIVEERRQDLAEKGPTFGIPVPSVRQMPLVAFGSSPLVICEVKRRSPSRGEIAPELDAADQAGIYVSRGIRSISVLTEERYFGGSLQDLMDIKARYPEAAVLRKDFLLEVSDIDVSYRAGADAVLLIAAMLSGRKLEELYLRAKSLGMEVLMEIHTAEDVAKVRGFSPGLIGINSRNLETFRIDPLLPLRVKSLVSWNASFVYESGISSGEGARLAFSAGFSGILVGEAVVRNPELAGQLLRELAHPAGENFWGRLYTRKREGVPLVKICGLARTEDVLAAEAAGADVLGFILAPSPRRVDISFLRSLKQTEVQKVAVVVSGNAAETGAGETGFYSSREVVNRLQDLISSGVIDAVQFHGTETPEFCRTTAFPYYKAVRIRSVEDSEAAAQFSCPRVLFDAYSKTAAGGTGRRIEEDLVREIMLRQPLWLAGGLGPANVAGVLRRYSVELLDASSSLEASPGVKDHSLIRNFFKEIERAVQSGREDQILS